MHQISKIYFVIELYMFRASSVPTYILEICEAWVLKKREEQRLEAAQMKFLRHLLGITKLDKKRISVLGKEREHRTYEY